MSNKAKAEAVARQDLARCTKEILDWQRGFDLPEDGMLVQVASAWEDGTPAHDSYQQAESLVTKLALKQVAGSDRSSMIAKLDWASRMLRSTADRGRAQLGDGYPEVLQVWGAINAILEGLAHQVTVDAETVEDGPLATLSDMPGQTSVIA